MYIYTQTYYFVMFHSSSHGWWCHALRSRSSWWAILTGPSTQWDGRTGACCGLWAMGRCSEFPGDAAGKLWENHGKCWENGGKSVSWSPKANWNSELQSEIWDGDSSGGMIISQTSNWGPWFCSIFARNPCILSQKYMCRLFLKPIQNTFQSQVPSLITNLNLTYPPVLVCLNI